PFSRSREKVPEGRMRAAFAVAVVSWRQKQKQKPLTPTLSRKRERGRNNGAGEGAIRANFIAPHHHRFHTPPYPTPSREPDRVPPQAAVRQDARTGAGQGGRGAVADHLRRAAPPRQPAALRLPAAGGRCAQ